MNGEQIACCEHNWIKKITCRPPDKYNFHCVHALNWNSKLTTRSYWRSNVRITLPLNSLECAERKFARSYVLFVCEWCELWIVNSEEWMVFFFCLKHSACMDVRCACAGQRTQSHRQLHGKHAVKLVQRSDVKHLCAIYSGDFDLAVCLFISISYAF